MSSAEHLTEKERQRVVVLTDILTRLHRGATPESVQTEFDQHFQGISAIEISLMEHQLIESDDNDITFEDVMKLCNVHANLFKNRVAEAGGTSEFEKHGHPVHVLKSENQAMRAAMMRINRLLQKLDGADVEPGIIKGLGNQLRLLGQFEQHYQRKEEIIFPVMEKYGHLAPPKVMWGVDDQIRGLFQVVLDELAQVETKGVAAVKESFTAFQHEFNEMIFKEESILIPLVLEVFNEDDWIAIALDSKQYGYAIVEPEEEWIPNRVDFSESVSSNKLKEDKQVQDKAETLTIDHLPRDKELPFGQGYLTLNEVGKILDLLPLELTFINKNDVFKYFNDSIPDEEKAFLRAPSAIGREVKNCHPPKSLAMVLQLIEDLRNGVKDKEQMWFERQNGQFIHVTYVAVRDDDGSYMGILEYVQDIQPLRALTGMKRGLD